MLDVGVPMGLDIGGVRGEKGRLRLELYRKCSSEENGRG